MRFFFFMARKGEACGCIMIAILDRAVEFNKGQVKVLWSELNGKSHFVVTVECCTPYLKTEVGR
jgi:hypothetical protein